MLSHVVRNPRSSFRNDDVLQVDTEARHDATGLEPLFSSLGGLKDFNFASMA